MEELKRDGIQVHFIGQDGLKNLGKHSAQKLTKLPAVMGDLRQMYQANRSSSLENGKDQFTLKSSWASFCSVSLCHFGLHSTADSKTWQETQESRLAKYYFQISIWQLGREGRLETNTKSKVW